MGCAGLTPGLFITLRFLPCWIQIVTFSKVPPLYEANHKPLRKQATGLVTPAM